jgi:hypothetical protein
MAEEKKKTFGEKHGWWMAMLFMVILFGGGYIYFTSDRKG